MGFFRPTAGALGITFNYSNTTTEEFRFVLNSTQGDFHATGDIIAFSTTPSDERLKKNIENLENGLSYINQLRPVSYDWKYREGSEYGLIAQEVEKVLPHIVKEKELLKTPDGGLYKTVSYEKLIPFLIKSIQELNEEINKLKNK